MCKETRQPHLFHFWLEIYASATTMEFLKKIQILSRANQLFCKKRIVISEKSNIFLELTILFVQQNFELILCVTFYGFINPSYNYQYWKFLLKLWISSTLVNCNQVWKLSSNIICFNPSTYGWSPCQWVHRTWSLLDRTSAWPAMDINGTLNIGSQQLDRPISTFTQHMNMDRPCEKIYLSSCEAWCLAKRFIAVDNRIVHYLSIGKDETGVS